MPITGTTGLACSLMAYHQALPAALRAEWETLAGEIGPLPVFQQPAWTEAGIRAGTVAPGFVLRFSEQGRMVGLLPCRARTRWTAEIAVTITRDISPFLIAPGFDALIYQRLLQWLRHDSPVAMLRLGLLPEAPMKLIIRLAAAQGMYAAVRPADATVWAPLPATWEAYLAGLSNSARTKLRRAENKLHAEVPEAEIDLLSEPQACAEAVDALVGLCHRRWSGAETASYLDNPRNAALLRDVMPRLAAQDAACVGVVRLHGRIIAAATAMHTPGQPDAFYQVFGRDLSALPNQYSPGILLVARLLRWAIERGAARMHLGHGALPYKLLLGGESVPLWDVTLARSQTHATVLCKVDAGIQWLRRHLTQSRR